MTGIIKEFQGEYRWLSNFSKAPAVIDGKHFWCNEQWFVYNKCAYEYDKKMVLELTDAGQIKRYGRRVTLVPKWETIKFQVMETGLRAKFDQNADLRQKLIDTYPAELQEGNTWGDRIWGIELKTGEGQNHLGKILMKIRQEYVDKTV